MTTIRQQMEFIHDQMYKADMWFVNPDNDKEVFDTLFNQNSSPTACPEGCTVEFDGICEHGYWAYTKLLDLEILTAVPG